MKRFGHIFSTITVALCAALMSCAKITHYTVTFDANGGEITYGQSVVTVAEGDALRYFNTSVERDGYWLTGWYTEAEAINEWDVYNDAVMGDMTLYAGWGNIYTVTFDAGGGTFLNHDGGGTWTTDLSAGSLLWGLDNVVKPGYVLEGWYRDIALTDRWDLETDTVTGSARLYAKWSEGIEGLTLDKYPRVDGATSTRALNYMIACKLLGIPYVWDFMSETNEMNVYPKGEFGHGDSSILRGCIATSQTHGAMMNLIHKRADIILRSTTASPDERAAAEAAGVTLVETPIALDAFVFIKHNTNPVQSLTLEQIRKIYTGQITDWSQVGGSEAPMTVYTRPRNSGSEEAFRELVMGEQEPAEFPEEQQIMSMAGLFWEMKRNPLGIAYIFKNYKEKIVGRYEPAFAIEGVLPSPVTMRDRTYPLTTEVYAIIRSDLDRTSTAYRLYEWLQSDAARGVLEECGFVSL
ncbi:MAG: InlB B-repeat-containing protein [Alistipes sp.]|jgi:phosphate transport system substrate-binding protein|nr:InlB B-repeat-containing protein [Alistipes sp.]